MPQQRILTLETFGQGLTEFTRQAETFVRDCGNETAILTIFIRHTSASLIIQENADPDVQTDLANFLNRLVPPSDDPAMNYIVHTSEGPDDMPAHIKAALTQTSLSIPVMNGKLALGTWQGIYLWEHRSSAHRREIILHLS